ncbi:MAG: cob(I)yrinic acid a,c-diamide adenosyltransferase [Phycisphaerae bacterium]|jgi:cob(I)alamin adenosyltransferase
MAIHAKHDDGDTGPGDGRRVRKSDPAVAALGDLDELNVHVGLCLQGALADGHKDIVAALEPLQAELCTLAAHLGGMGTTFDGSAVARLERQIDAAWAELPPLEKLILPRGCELACRLHVARTVCRRAERAIVALADAGAGAGTASKKVPPEVLRYLNRLSDLLFALARLANHYAGTGEETWPQPD